LGAQALQRSGSTHEHTPSSVSQPSSSVQPQTRPVLSMAAFASVSAFAYAAFRSIL
jgi:hypothetical protein